MGGCIDEPNGTKMSKGGFSIKSFFVACQSDIVHGVSIRDFQLLLVYKSIHGCLYRPATHPRSKEAAFCL
jgi:hypothetical protein